MRFFKYVPSLFLLLLTVSSCSESNYRFKLRTIKNTKAKKLKLGETVTIELEQLSGTKPDSVKLYVGTKQFELKDNKAIINTSEVGIGKHQISVLAFIPNKVKKVNNSIEVYSNIKPEVYTAKIVNTYSHDQTSFVQGLEYYNGFLYETTGKKGRSRLRKINLTTGEVLQQYDLSDKYFGEGMTIVGDKLFWLTWQAGKGFIFDLNSFKLIKEFPYNRSIEGWGLTHSEKELIKSDGTSKIWFLNPENQQEKRSIQVYTDNVSLEKLNELEYINGKIYANYWQKPLIAIINPENGVVEGIIDLRNVVEEVEKTQKLVEGEDVLNGIAFDAENNRLFVTGKNWSKLFEIETIKK